MVGGHGSWAIGVESHVVSGSAVVVRGWSHSPRIVVGDGCGWVCSSSFMDFDRGEVVVVRACFVAWWAIVVGGWLVQCG